MSSTSSGKSPPPCLLYAINQPDNITIKSYQNDVLITFLKGGSYVVICEGESEDRNIWTHVPHTYFGAANIVVKSK